MNYDLREFTDFLEKEYGFIRESNKVAFREGDELVSALQNETDEIISDLVGEKKLCCGGASVDGAKRLIIKDKCGNVLYVLKMGEAEAEINDLSSDKLHIVNII